MEGLLITLAVALVVGVPVAVIVLLVWVSRLNSRVAWLESELLSRPKSELSPKPEPAPGPETENPAEPVPMMAAAATPPYAAEPPAPPPPPPPPPSEPEAYTPPKAVVLRAETASALGVWLRDNWIYAVAAVSLAAAGIFMVQYGIEKGWLTPVARVIGALAFGAALIFAGEYLRRRWGDGEDSPAAYLPSVFSGAGLVTLFGAVLAALHLYALIGPGAALFGLIVVALAGIVLGWFTGPLLAALGVGGAFAAPFLVGGESEMGELFYVYFGLFAVMGLAIDAIRRWAWVSLLTLVMAYGAAWLLHQSLDKPEWYAWLLAFIVPAAIAIPVLRLTPTHGGAGLADGFRPGLSLGWPTFPTRLAAGAMLASAAIIAALGQDGAAMFWLAIALELALFAAIALWAREAGALEDLALWPVLAVLALPLMQATVNGDVYAAFRAWPQTEPGTPMPISAYLLVALAAGISVVAAGRSLTSQRWPVAWAAGAALTAPLMMLGLELRWVPAEISGAYPWAIAAMAIAALMGIIAGAFARADGEARLRPALAALSALTMIAFALVVVLSETALTLALAATVVAAAALDRQFRLKPMTWFVAVGVVTLGWRLVLDPGLPWARHAPYWELVLAYGGSIAALVAAMGMLRASGRDQAVRLAESGAWTLAAVLASVLIGRVIEDLSGRYQTDSHWAMGLYASVWLASAANQVWRTQNGGALAWIRVGLAAIYSVIGLAALGAGLTIANPLFEASERVLGPAIANTLAVAYLMPALLLAIVARRFTFLPRPGRLVLAAGATALATFWLALAIRQLWHGAIIALPGVTQPELYSYTIAMLVIGAVLLWQAIARGSTPLRRIAMTVIALTVAKVFLVDASGLTGLTRVFSFLALGLSLAGLAFLNRWAAGQAQDGASTGTPDGDDGK